MTPPLRDELGRFRARKPRKRRHAAHGRFARALRAFRKLSPEQQIVYYLELSAVTPGLPPIPP